MALREIIRIDEDKCNGCGECITGCHEGALQIVDGKAKLVNEDFCDGFGDCIGECPTGALKVERREAKEFDLEATAEHVKNIRGEEAVREMLEAQKVHEEKDYHSGCPGGMARSKPKTPAGGCPGSRMRTIDRPKSKGSNEEGVELQSQLQQWPVQISLVPPNAPYFYEADLLITADCVPAAYADYHQKLLKGKAIAMGCPKLDDGEAYVEKLSAIIENNNLNSIAVARMEVPCCGGLVRILQEAVKRANSDLEVEIVTIGVDGELRD